MNAGEVEQLRSRIRGLSEPRGTEVRDLHIAGRILRFRGLDADLARTLELRWGGFLLPGSDAAAHSVVDIFPAGLERPVLPVTPSEAYRMERLDPEGETLVASYHFAIVPAAGGGNRWRVALMASDDEPTGRMLDNVARYFAARLAIDAGGFSLHAAGVRRQGRAYLFAGPSRAGKSTAVALSGAESLGDDLGVVIRRDDRWLAAALPFDNSETRGVAAPPAPLPLAGIWRLYQGAEARVDEPPPALAVASLMACAAFPWAIPELADPLLQHVQSFVTGGGFAHLTFALDSDLWKHLVP